MSWKLEKALRPEIASEELWRPDWSASGARDPKLLWLDKNENRDPELREVFKKIQSEIRIESLAEYPDAAPLYERLADFVSVSVENLLITPGSDGAIRAVFEVFIERGDAVLHTVPTFAMYDVYCKMYGAKQIAVEYEPSDNGPSLALEKLKTVIEKEQPKLVCLPNPNSPSGTVYTPEEIEQLIQHVGVNNGIILVDEAYHPFYEETAVPHVEDHPNLLVARTFSKAWGLAGLRIGYLVGHSEAMKYLHKVKAMYEVGAYSMSFIYQMLAYKDEMLASVNRLRQGAEYFIEEMEKLNYHVIRCHGNFIHVSFGDDAESIHARLSDLVLYRADGGHKSLKGYSRFSTTTKERFEPVVAEIKRN